MRLLVIIPLLFTSLLFAQETERWEKSEVSYLLPETGADRDYSIDGSNPLEVTAEALLVLYRAGFSDFDGDNCAFRPSCSHFYEAALRETNFVEATLLFADRFTRDSNPVKTGYRLLPEGKLHDPLTPYLHRHGKE